MATCLYCSSECRVSLLVSSEGCTNPKCRAYESPVASYVSSMPTHVGKIPPRPEFKIPYKAQFIEPYEPQYVTTPADRTAWDREGFWAKIESVRRDAARTVRSGHGEEKPKPKVFYFHTGGVDVGDIHAETAAKMFSKPLEDVTPEDRKAAKTASLAVLFGGGNGRPNANGRVFEEHVLEKAFIDFQNSRAMGYSMSTKVKDTEPCCYGMCVAGNQHSDDCEK
jgi:hypothetical protein